MVNQHGFTTIWKKMFEAFSNHPGQANRSTWYVNQSTNLLGDFLELSPKPKCPTSGGLCPDENLGWCFYGCPLGNETNEVFFITANQPSPEPPHPNIPPGNKASLRAHWVWGVGWLAMISWLGNGGWNFPHSHLHAPASFWVGWFWFTQVHHSQEALRALKRSQSVGYEGLRNLPLPLPAWQPLSWRPALEVEHAFTTRIVRQVTGALRRRLEILLDVVCWMLSCWRRFWYVLP